MARPPKGKPLTMRTVRLDDDVWAECQRLGKEHGTINEGIAVALAALRMQEAQGRVMAETGDPWKAVALASDASELRQALRAVGLDTDDNSRHRRAERKPLLKPSEKKKG